MSSPIASRKKGPLDRTLISIHRKLSHSHRIEVLSRRIAELIQLYYPAAREIRCLDVGCGDMQIAERVAALAPNTSWSCIDIHELPQELKNAEQWKKYRTFDGTNIPFPNKSFDIVLFCDVLHHVRTNTQALLKEAAVAGRLVVIKDHFEYSIFSRIMLWAMDFLGNWGYGVSLPKRYFTRQSFEDLAGTAGLRPKQIEAGIDLYSHIPAMRTILRPKWQFLAVLEQVT